MTRKVWNSQLLMLPLCNGNQGSDLLLGETLEVYTIPNLAFLPIQLPFTEHKLLLKPQSIELGLMVEVDCSSMWHLGRCGQGI